MASEKEENGPSGDLIPKLVKLVAFFGEDGGKDDEELLIEELFDEIRIFFILEDISGWLWFLKDWRREDLLNGEVGVIGSVERSIVVEDSLGVKYSEEFERDDEKSSVSGSETASLRDLPLVPVDFGIGTGEGGSTFLDLDLVEVVDVAEIDEVSSIDDVALEEFFDFDFVFKFDVLEE